MELTRRRCFQRSVPRQQPAPFVSLVKQILIETEPDEIRCNLIPRFRKVLEGANLAETLAMAELARERLSEFIDERIKP